MGKNDLIGFLIKIIIKPVTSHGIITNRLKEHLTELDWKRVFLSNRTEIWEKFEKCKFGIEMNNSHLSYEDTCSLYCEF